MRLQRLLQTPELILAIFAFLLNLAWEVWQVPFFRGMADQPHWLGVKACTLATFGDAGIALAAFWITAFFARTRSWIMQPGRSDIATFIGLGLAATITLETLSACSTAGTTAMPCRAFRSWEPDCCRFCSGWQFRCSCCGSFAGRSGYQRRSENATECTSEIDSSVCMREQLRNANLCDRSKSACGSRPILFQWNLRFRNRPSVGSA
jgi:hypothetical protein